MGGGGGGGGVCVCVCVCVCVRACVHACMRACNVIYSAMVQPFTPIQTVQAALFSVHNLITHISKSHSVLENNGYLFKLNIFSTFLMALKFANKLPNSIQQHHTRELRSNRNV